MNKTILIGRLGGDPESQTIGENSTTLTKFQLATTERRGADKEDDTEWHSIEAWGKAGELCAKYLKKGSQVCVIGRLKTNRWEEDVDGKTVKRSKTVIVLSEVEFLSKSES